jgi:hypothetical protein
MKFPCDTCEFNPHKPFQNFLAVGTYLLNETGDKFGNIEGFKLINNDEEFSLIEINSCMTDAVLDIKWAPYASVNNLETSSGILACACSGNALQFAQLEKIHENFNLKKIKSDPLLLPHTTTISSYNEFISSIINTSYFSSKIYRMGLSLDWYLPSTISNSKLAVSHDNRLVSIVQTSFLPLYSNASSSSTTASSILLIPTYIWDAHEYDVWCVCFGHPQNYSNVVITGADDCKVICLCFD